MVDMPIEKLELYMGSNPKPKDFEEYWERALQEMKGVESNVIFEPSPFTAPLVECYDMYFTGVGGARIHVKHLKPKNINNKIPAIIKFHGYGYYCGSWSSDNMAYGASGYAVFSMDVRGQGGDSEDSGQVKGNTQNGHIIRGLADHPDKMFYRNVFLDAAQLAGIVMNLNYVDETKVYATGDSQGGALTLACAALEPRIAKIAPIFPFLCDYKRVWDMDLDMQAYAEMRDYFRNYDPRHEKENEIFLQLGYIDLQYLAPRIKGKVLMFTALMDNVCPPSTQYAAYNKMTCSKKHVLYYDYGHEYLRDSDDMIFEFFVNDKF